MKKTEMFDEAALAALAKKFRIAAGKRPVDVAKEMGVKQPSIHNAEDQPSRSFTKLRKRMIETYSPFKVVGPVYFLVEK